MTKLVPLTEVERQIISNMLYTLGTWLLPGHVPDLALDYVDRLVGLLDLPPHHRFEKFEQHFKLSSSRISPHYDEDELRICIAWLDSVISIFSGRAPNNAMVVATRLRELLYILATKKCRSLWREFDNDEKQCRLLERI